MKISMNLFVISVLVLGLLSSPIALAQSDSINLSDTVTATVTPSETETDETETDETERFIEIFISKICFDDI